MVQSLGGLCWNRVFSRRGSDGATIVRWAGHWAVDLLTASVMAPRALWGVGRRRENGIVAHAVRRSLCGDGGRSPTIIRGQPLITLCIVADVPYRLWRSDIPLWARWVRQVWCQASLHTVWYSLLHGLIFCLSWRFDFCDIELERQTFSVELEELRSDLVQPKLGLVENHSELFVVILKCFSYDQPQSQSLKL